LTGSENDAIRDSYFTAATDEYHEGVFTWCANNSTPLNMSSDLKLMKGEPGGGKGENCMSVVASGDATPNNFILGDYPCDKPYKFICEVRNLLNLRVH